MPSIEEKILTQVATRAEEMSQDLTDWAKEELLLKAGQKIRVTIEIVQEELVEVVVQLSPKKSFTKIPTDKDWEEIRSLPWNTRLENYKSLSTEEILELLTLMQKGGGRATFNKHHWDNDSALYNFLRKHGDRFRISRAAHTTTYTLRVAE